MLVPLKFDADIAPLKVAEVPPKVPVSVPPANGSLVASAIVILVEPLKGTPLIFLVFANIVASSARVAVSALPVVFWFQVVIVPVSL